MLIVAQKDFKGVSHPPRFICTRVPPFGKSIKS